MGDVGKCGSLFTCGKTPTLEEILALVFSVTWQAASYCL